MPWPGVPRPATARPAHLSRASNPLLARLVSRRHDGLPAPEEGTLLSTPRTEVEPVRADAPAEVAVHLDGVRKRFGDVVAVDRVDLEVRQDEFLLGSISAATRHERRGHPGDRCHRDPDHPRGAADPRRGDGPGRGPIWGRSGPPGSSYSPAAGRRPNRRAKNRPMARNSAHTARRKPLTGRAAT
jgi:hypothetical protein